MIRSIDKWQENADSAFYSHDKKGLCMQNSWLHKWAIKLVTGFPYKLLAQQAMIPKAEYNYKFYGGQPLSPS